MAVSAHGTLLKMGDGALPTEAFTTIPWRGATFPAGPVARHRGSHISRQHL